jgi:hypothetical protein
MQPREACVAFHQGTPASCVPMFPGALWFCATIINGVAVSWPGPKRPLESGFPAPTNGLASPPTALPGGVHYAAGRQR